jgi:hypothetical protein
MNQGVIVICIGVCRLIVEKMARFFRRARIFGSEVAVEFSVNVIDSGGMNTVPVLVSFLVS